MKAEGDWQVSARQGSRRRPLGLIVISSALALILLVWGVSSFLLSDFFLNRRLKPRIQRAFVAAYPSLQLDLGHLHYGLRENRLSCDSVILKKKNSGAICQARRCSLTGVNWRRALLRKGHLVEILADARLAAAEIELRLSEVGYTLACQQLHASIPESAVECGAIQIQPLGSDEEFFAARPFRSTRFRVKASHCQALGLAWSGLLQGRGYLIRSLQLEDLVVGSLTDREKPINPQPHGPFTPYEALALLQRPLTIENLEIRNGRLTLAQSRRTGTEPGELTFGNVHLSAKGISNHAVPNSTASVQTQSRFMDAAPLEMSMEMSLTSPKLSLRYSGSVGKLDLLRLNPFLEAVGRVRITSGMFQEGLFRINVLDDHARGEVRAVYRDLNITLLDKATGIERGLVNEVESFLADRLVLHPNNNPEVSKSIRIGTVNYTRKPQERFPHFLWFAVRHGLYDVLGVEQYVKAR